MNSIKNPIKVYVKTDLNNNIVEIGSSIFIKNIYEWTYIDEGYGDRYAHAQSQYFDKPLIDNYGNYNYKYENGKIISVYY